LRENFSKIANKGGEVMVGYYQALAKEEVKEEEKIDRPIEQIVEDALKFVPDTLSQSFAKEPALQSLEIASLRSQ
jgi:hypothetical protein